MLMGSIALAIAAAFAGAAVYINFAGHPARMALPMAEAVRQWRPAYLRGFIMQASPAVIGGAFALVQWRLSGGTAWLAGGLLLANWPFTLLVIMPVNRRLEAGQPGSDPETGALLQRWNRLHAVRSGFGLLSVGTMLLGAAY
ncbi:MAG: DUF1772 domain-containing protein [Novosphingobium sp.]|jgi:hypothetical protein|nr:DUF1772 domain-containing protein [Novosphingobium sp.]